MTRKEKVKEALRERFADKVCIFPVDEVKTCFDLRRPIGLVSLDAILYGGFPAGTINILYGPPGIGKDLLANLCIKELQRNYGDNANVLLASFGYRYDLRFASRLGVVIPWSDADIKQLEQEYGQELDEETKKYLKRRIGNIDTLVVGDVSSIDEVAEATAETILQAVASKRYQIIVCNELGAHYLDEKEGIGKTARFFDLFVKKYFAIMNQTSRDYPNETTLLLISQVRSKFGHGFSYYDYVGGNALKHASAVVLELSGGETRQDPTGPIGKVITCTIRKAKYGSHEGRKTKIYYDYTTGVDYYTDLIDSALEYGIIKRSGIYYEVPTVGRVKSKTRIQELLNEDESLYSSIRGMTLKAAGVTNVRYR